MRLIHFWINQWKLRIYMFHICLEKLLLYSKCMIFCIVPLQKTMHTNTQDVTGTIFLLICEFQIHMKVFGLGFKCKPTALLFKILRSLTAFILNIKFSCPQHCMCLDDKKVPKIWVLSFNYSSWHFRQTKNTTPEC